MGTLRHCRDQPRLGPSKKPSPASLCRAQRPLLHACMLGRCVVSSGRILWGLGPDDSSPRLGPSSDLSVAHPHSGFVAVLSGADTTSACTYVVVPRHRRGHCQVSSPVAPGSLQGCVSLVLNHAAARTIGGGGMTARTRPFSLNRLGVSGRGEAGQETTGHAMLPACPLTIQDFPGR